MAQTTTAPTEQQVMGGATKTYEIYDDDGANLRNLRIQTLALEKWHSVLGPVLSGVLGEPSDEIARALSIYDNIPGEIRLTLQTPEHNDVDVNVELLETTDDNTNLQGIVRAVAGNPTITSVVNAYKHRGIVVDEPLLAISEANENLFANGVIKENPEVLGSFVLEVTTEWDTLD